MRSKFLFIVQKLRLIWSTSFGFAQKHLIWFSKCGIELIEALSSTNATKRKQKDRATWQFLTYFYLFFSFLPETNTWTDRYWQLHPYCAPPGWLMTWWLWVRDPVEAKLLSGVFSPLTSAEAFEKCSRWLWKEIFISTGVRKPGNTCASPSAMIWRWLLKWR